MKKLRYIFAAALTGLLLTTSTALAQPLYAATASSNDACEALQKLDPNKQSCGDSNSDSNKIIRLALNMLSIIAGVIAVIMLIVSGFKYITSQGDANQIAGAKNSLIYAVVGLVIVALSQAIVKFVLARSINA